MPFKRSCLHRQKEDAFRAKLEEAPVAPEGTYILPVDLKGKAFVFPQNSIRVATAITRMLKITHDELCAELGIDLDDYDERNIRSFNILIENFNKKFKKYCMEKHAEGTPFSQWLPNSMRNLSDSRKLTFPNAAGLIECAYEMAVRNPKALNSGRNDKTYGETLLPQMNLIIEELKMKRSDVFLDMGSGIGQLVLLVATITPVHKSIGIELAKGPFKMAKKLQGQYSRLMAHFGKRHNEFQLLKGNFLAPKFANVVMEATIILVNNKKFSEGTKLKINELLMLCSDGTRIISTERLVLESRNGGAGRVHGMEPRAQELDDIVTTKELTIFENNVSWGTCQYFLTTIKRP